MAEEQSTLELVVELVDNASEKMEGIKNKTQEANESVSEGMDDASDAADNIKESMKENADAADEAENSFLRMTGQGLSLLFVGRFLQQTFGGLSRQMLDFVGVTDQASSTMKNVLSPAFVKLSEDLQPFFETLNNLSPAQKMAAGKAAIFATALAGVLAVGGLLIATYSAWAGVLGSVAGAIGLSTGAAAALTAAFAGLAAGGAAFGFKLGQWLPGELERLEEDLKSLNRFLDNIFKGNWKTAWGEIENIVDNRLESTGSLISKFLTDKQQLELIAIKKAFKEVGKDMIDAIIEGFDEKKDAFQNWFENNLTPNWTLDGQSDLGGGNGGTGSVKSWEVTDFVMSGDRLIKTHPNDVIFGTKEPDKLGAGAGGGNITINVDRPRLENDMDIDRMVDKIEERIDRDTRGRSGIA